MQGTIFIKDNGIEQKQVKKLTWYVQDNVQCYTHGDKWMGKMFQGMTYRGVSWQLHAILTNDYDDSQTYMKMQKHMKMHDNIHIYFLHLNMKYL